jgi:PKD repeat protein
MFHFSLFKPAIFLASALLFTGCVDFDSSVKEGDKLTDNNQSIVFTATSHKAKHVLKLKKRHLYVNSVDQKADTTLRYKKRHNRHPLEIHYTPTPPNLLPQGDVTIELNIPYKRAYWARRFLGVDHYSKTIHIFVDSEAPVINTLSPEENSTIRDALTPLLYTVKDITSDIDTTSLIVTLNGQDITALATIIDGNVTITPQTGALLPEGNFTVTLSIADTLGNSAQQSFHYIGSYDEIAPSVRMISPNEGAIINDPLSPLVFDIYDDVNGSGLDENSTQITFTDTNETFTLIKDANSSYFVYTPTDINTLPYGKLDFIIHAQDKAGNTSQTNFSIFVQEKNVLSAIPIASPQTAYAPATIRFSPKVTTNNAIQTYSWDFTGNGSYERSDITANSYTWQYTTPGDYNVSLRVVDANNEVIIGTTTVHILNAPPVVTVESAPSNGAIPLTVNFTVTATDADGIALYEWDFDGDGVYDYSSTSTGNTSFEYTTQGVFNAQLRVTDTKGGSSLYTTPTTKVLALSTGSPSVTASASVLSGNAPLVVNFSANAIDPQGLGFKLYEWDFDGDGVYDYNSTNSATTSFTYEEAGTVYPKIRVTTTDDRVTYDALELKVAQSVGLSVSTDTLDVAQSASVTINVTNSAKGQLRVMIEDENYNPVTVIQDWSVLTKGAHTYTWDGMVNGNAVKEGKYYAVAYYKVDGNIKKVDLRDTTGGSRYNPSRNNAPYTFAPFDNKPLKMTFSLPRASEVVSFIGYSYSNTRIVTFRSRQPLGRGSYTDTWSALNDEGIIITPPPGKYFMYGVWAFSLADNAIYVQSGAHPSAITATPPIYTPDAYAPDGTPAKLTIHFTLNKPATIELEVFDARLGTTVATREYLNIPSGDQIVEFDGRDNKGVFLHPGKYSVGLRAVDENGYRSIMEYTVTRIYY